MGDELFIEGRAAAHEESAGTSVAFPHVCLCDLPPGAVVREVGPPQGKHRLELDDGTSVRPRAWT